MFRRLGIRYCSSSPLSITQITEYLYTKGIDFSDCRDPSTLRARYTDVLAGTYQDPAIKKKLDELAKIREDEQKREYARVWEREKQLQQQDQKDGGGLKAAPPPPPKSEGLTTERSGHKDGEEISMGDGTKFVWELKKELCARKGFDPIQTDIWCGKEVLVDHRRVYDYLDILQKYPIALRKKTEDA